MTFKIASEREFSPGRFVGDKWHPHVTDAKKRAALAAKEKEYDCALIDDEIVYGRLHIVTAYGDDENNMAALQPRYTRKGDELVEASPGVLCPDHGLLTKRAEQLVKRYGEGVMVAITLEGKEKIQEGKWKGKDSYLYALKVLKEA